MKYALFAGDVFYASGGAKDFVAYGDTLDELKQAHQEIPPWSCSWAHIVDTETMNIVLEWRSSDCNNDLTEEWRVLE